MIKGYDTENLPTIRDMTPFNLTPHIDPLKSDAFLIGVIIAAAWNYLESQ